MNANSKLLHQIKEKNKPSFMLSDLLKTEKNTIKEFKF